MIIDFEEKNHVYSINGDIATISVTELLHKHGLAPNYKGANESTLKKNAEKGKEVHKDLENVLNEAKYEPKTEQGKNFKAWCFEHIDCGVGEQMLGMKYKGLTIAGTADVMAINKKGQFIIGDHKNTAKKNIEYVRWQVSLLDYMARKLGKSKVNGKALNWGGAKEFWLFKYDKTTGELDAVALDPIDDFEIETLLDCEVEGKTYQRPALVLDKEFENAVESVEFKLFALESERKKIEETASECRKKLCELMEAQGITKWESPRGIVVTYNRATEMVGVDSRKLKDKYPKVFEDCQKLTKKSAYVRVSVKDFDDTL